MRKITLPKIAKTHPIAFWLAVVLHLALLVGLIFSSISQWEIEQQKPKKPSKPVPKAITIDLKEIQEETQRLVDIEIQKDSRIKREEKRLREAEDKRYKTQQKINRLKATTKDQKKAKDLAEKETKEAEKNRKIAEQKTVEAEKNRKIAEREAVEAEKLKELLEALRKTESQKFKTEQSKRNLTREIQTEEDQEREIALENILNELKASYTNQIGNRVKDQWHYRGAKDDWRCRLDILQDEDGVVKTVNVHSCNVDNKSFKDSVERAVYKASPLPAAPDKSVFDRELVIHFKVNE